MCPENTSKFCWRTCQMPLLTVQEKKSICAHPHGERHQKLFIIETFIGRDKELGESSIPLTGREALEAL